MIQCRPPVRLSFTAKSILARGLGWVSWFALVLVVDRLSLADDWPQILGPGRDGASSTRGLAAGWPGQLKPKWTVSLGSGFAGAAVISSKVLVPHRVADQELLAAFNLETGKLSWQTTWKASYRGGYNPDSGPRCVPTVSGDKAIVYGAAGDLQCIGLTDGKLLWGRPLRAEYDADDGYFGAGSAPLIVDDLVVVCLGGKQAGVVAVDLDSGKTRWTATSYDASYAAPIDVSQGTTRRVLVVTRLHTLLIDADSGKVLSNVRFGSVGPTVNAATPIRIAPDKVLLTASYNIGAAVLKLEGDQLVEEYRAARLLSSQYNTPVVVGDRVVGIDGREDAGVASLRAIDAKSQRLLWEKSGFGTAHLISLGDHVLSLSIAGRLDLIDGRADSYRELATSTLPSGTYRALPALVDKQLIIRATKSPSETELMLFELP